jgi:hypothetical protein
MREGRYRRAFYGWRRRGFRGGGDLSWRGRLWDDLTRYPSRIGKGVTGVLSAGRVGGDPGGVAGSRGGAACEGWVRPTMPFPAREGFLCGKRYGPCLPQAAQPLLPRGCCLLAVEHAPGRGWGRARTGLTMAPNGPALNLEQATARGWGRACGTTHQATACPSTVSRSLLHSCSRRRLVAYSRDQPDQVRSSLSPCAATR